MNYIVNKLHPLKRPAAKPCIDILCLIQHR